MYTVAGVAAGVATLALAVRDYTESFPPKNRKRSCMLVKPNPEDKMAGSKPSPALIQDGGLVPRTSGRKRSKTRHLAEGAC